MIRWGKLLLSSVSLPRCRFRVVFDPLSRIK